MPCGLPAPDCADRGCAQVDGDSRWIAALTVLFVKTSKAALEDGFNVAIQEDGCAVADTIYIDAVRLPLPTIALFCIP